MPQTASLLGEVLLPEKTGWLVLMCRKKVCNSQMLLAADHILRGQGSSGDFLLALLLEQICHLVGGINFFTA